MRFIILVRAGALGVAGAVPPPAAALAAYHDELARAGVLLDAGRLLPGAPGWRVHFRGGRGRIVDGPFGAAKDPVAGYTLIEVRSPDEALEWARRHPAPYGDGTDAEIELRPLAEPDEAPPAHR